MYFNWHIDSIFWLRPCCMYELECVCMCVCVCLVLHSLPTHHPDWQLLHLISASLWHVLYVLQTTYSELHTLSDGRLCVCVRPDSSGLIKELACQKLALSLFNIDLISSYKCVCTHVCVCVLLVWHIWVCLKTWVIPHNLVFLEVTHCTWQEIRQVLQLILTYKSLLVTQQIVTTHFEVVFLKTPFMCIIRLCLWSCF